MDLGLMGTGVVTALPLLWFAEAARRLPLSTMGFVQYLSPTGQLLIGVWLYGEPFGGGRAVAFVLHAHIPPSAEVVAPTSPSATLRDM